MFKFWQVQEIDRLAKKYKNKRAEIVMQLIEYFGYTQTQTNLMADMLEFIDEELAIRKGNRSVRN